MTWEIRDTGNKFSHAFLDSDNEWALISEPWATGNGNVWQTTYRLKLDGVTDPITAVSTGQQYFNKSPLTTSAIRSNGPDEGSIYCFYEPESSNYLVTVSNGMNYGIKRKA